TEIAPTVPTLEWIIGWLMVTLLPLVSNTAPPGPTLALLSVLIQFVLLEPATSLVPLKLTVLLELVAVPPAMAAPALPVVLIVTVPPLRFSVPLDVRVLTLPPIRIALPLLVVLVIEL